MNSDIEELAITIEQARRDHRAIARILAVYNSSTTNPQDIVNEVSRALSAAGYELRY